MFSITYEIRISNEKTIEVPLNRRFYTLGEAKKEAKSNILAIGYRIFDHTGFRVFSERFEKNS
jgi:hypothetical protein